MNLRTTLIFLLSIGFLGFTFVPEAHAQASYEHSMISTLQTEPTLAAGENLTVSIWLLDASGRLQDQESRKVYVWLEETSSPGLMSPALGEGDPYVSLDVSGSLYEKELLVTIPGSYSLHASLYPPSAIRIANGTQLEITNPDLHPIQVTPGAALPPQGNYRFQTDRPVDFRITIPKGEPGLAIRMQLEQRAGLPYPSNHPVKLSSPDGRLKISPQKLETNSQGEILFRLESQQYGNSQVLLQIGGESYTIPVEVTRKEAVYFIGRSRATFSGGEAYLDAVPVVHDSRTYVPLRSFVEAFGGSISYDNGHVSFNLDGRQVIMIIGQNQYFVNGEGQNMDASPYISPGSNRTMVPVRFLAEGLDLSVMPQYNAQGYVDAVLIQE